jgi:tyrosyl-tRNA synthetase
MTTYERALQTILRGVVDLVTREELEAKLRRGKPLRVKLGVDPSSSDLHLGHTVVLRKLRQFQDLGHQAILLIGTFTAMIGDPTGQSKTRPQLTPDQVEENAKTYLDQVRKVLDMNKLQIVRNGDWLGPMTFRDVIKWASKMTVARTLEREDFNRRYKQGNPIGLHEFMYVLMQAYDSVHLRADVELGGHDQLFNLLAARDLMRDDGQEPQVALTVPLLVGTDGDLKMSKSYGNHIGIKEEPYEMFSKVMRIPDSIMENYFTLLTDIAIDEVRTLCDPAKTHPMDAKKRLAAAITAGFSGEEAGRQAMERWSAEKQEGKIEQWESIALGSADMKDGKVQVRALVRKTGIPQSNAEATRLIEQGGVDLDGERLKDPNAQIEVRTGMMLRVGKKKRYFRLEIQ